MVKKKITAKWERLARFLFPCPHNIKSHGKYWCECTPNCLFADEPYEDSK